MRWPKVIILLLAFAAGSLRAAEVIPPAPRDHFNDYAGIVSRATATQLDAELTQLERDTSSQIVVAIFPKMQSDSSVEDYAVRVFQAWHVGTKEKNNGAVLFVFRDDHKIWISTGYGLEGAIPDARAKQIIENEITPRFRQGDFTGGVAAGTRALIASARGEYRGTGRTVAERRRGSGGGGGFPVVIFFGIVGLLILSRILSRRRGIVYGRGGRRSVWVNNGPWFGGGGGWGGGGGGSSWSGGGGGSFSGGGGSTGGGGAGGSW